MLKWLLTASKIAEAYLYLVRADYANGSLVTIDGGTNKSPNVSMATTNSS